MATLNLNKSVKERNKLAKVRQKEIEKFYMGLAKRVKKESEELEYKEGFKAQYLKRIEKELNQQVASFNKELEKNIKKDMLKTAQAVIQDNQSWIDKTSLGIKGAFVHLSAETVESILTGQVYENKWSLSSAIWGNTKKFSKDINKIVAEGVALNKSAYDIAKDLEMYVDPKAKKTWDWSKVYPGTDKQIDYSAQRLARTMVQHAYQQTLERTLKNNPFNKGIKWRSALIPGRTCEICRERNGKVYQKGKLPLDHPNGLCTFLPVMEDLEDVATELADWVNGKSSPGIDKWVKSMKG